MFTWEWSKKNQNGWLKKLIFQNGQSPKFFRELPILKNKLYFGGHFEFLFFFKKMFFCFILILKGQNFMASKVGSEFWWLPWFPAVFYPGQTFCTRVYIPKTLQNCVIKSVETPILNILAFSSMFLYCSCHQTTNLTCFPLKSEISFKILVNIVIIWHPAMVSMSKTQLTIRQNVT